MNIHRHVRTLAARPSLPDSRPAVAVLAGDLLVLLVFVSAGIYRHGGIPWEVPQHTLEALAPFLIAWLLVAPLAGLYHRETLTDYRWTLLLVVLAWFVAAVLGARIRATSLFPGNAPTNFVVANMLVGTLFVLPWRIAAVWLRRRFGQ